MIDFSLTEKLVQLKDIIMSSPFFFVSLIIGIVLLTIMIVGIKKNRRINKLIFIITWLFVAIFCIARYFKFFISIFDRLFGRIVDELYFPSMSSYTVVLIFTNIVFALSFIKKKINNVFKIINVAFAMIIDFLFILILDTLMKSNVDISARFDIYMNSKLLVLLEVSMSVFAIWMIIVLILYLINKYAVKKIFVNNYKESDYEFIDTKEANDQDIEIIDDDNLGSKNKINDNNQLEILDINVNDDNTEMLDL